MTADIPAISFPTTTAIIYEGLYDIVKAKWSAKVKDAETAKAEFIITPFLSISLIIVNVVTLVARVEINPIEDVWLIPIFLPKAVNGLLSNFLIINIRGNIPVITIAILKTVIIPSLIGVACGMIS